MRRSGGVRFGLLRSIRSNATAAVSDDPKSPPPDAILPEGVSGETDPVLEVVEGGISLPAWAPLRLSARHMMMIELHLQGFKNTAIADLLKCHEVTVGLVLRSQPAQDVLRERVEHVNLDFQAQFRQVVDTFADALDPDVAIDVRLKAADMWLKAHGNYEPKNKKKEGGGKLTIEDVIAELDAGTVNINIDNRKQTYYSGGAPWQPAQTPPSQTSREDSLPEPEALPKVQGQRR